MTEKEGGKLTVKVDDGGAKTVEKKEEDEGPPPVSLTELYMFTSPTDRLLLLIAAIAATGSGLAMPMMLIAFGDAFDQLGVSETLPGESVMGEKMNEMLLTFVWIGLGQFAGKFLYVSIAQYLCSSQILQYKTQFLKAVLRQEVAWYDVSNPEALTTKFGDSIVKVQKGISAQTFVFFEGIGYSGGAAIMAFLYQPKVAGVALATVPVLVLPALTAMYIVENGSKLIKQSYEKAGGIATEALFSMRTVVSLGIEKSFEERYTASLGGASAAFIKNQTIFGISVGCFLSAYLVMMVAGMIYGVWELSSEMEDSSFDLVIPSGVDYVRYCANELNEAVEFTRGPTCPEPLVPFQMSCQTAQAYVLAGVDSLNFTSTGEFRTFLQGEAPPEYLDDNSSYFGCLVSNTKVLVAIFAIMMTGEGLGMVGQPYQHVQEARLAAAKILEVIRRRPTIDAFDEGGQKPSACRGEIVLKDVVFSYPTAPDQKVCNGLNLEIPAGRTMALCGPSGSGKSTIIQLLERFYDPGSGSVSLDGAELRSLNVRWLRAQLGLVGQNPVLFQGTVAENIGYGKPTPATQQEIEEAARLANAHTFISEKPKGYETEVGEGGKKLSGGQKQRVAIARALVKKPAVLLLDEATASLDNTSEAAVQAALDRIMREGNMTTVIIAHRLSTIRNAHCISVLQDGRVAEQGTFEELNAQEGGLFQKLAQRQEAMLARDKASLGGGFEASGAWTTEPKDSMPEVGSGSGVELQLQDMSASAKEGKEGGEEGEGKDGEKKKEEEEDPPMLPAIKRLFAMQRPNAGHLTVMFILSAGASVCPSIAFYKVTEVMTVLFGPDPEQMRDDTVSISTLMGVLAACTIFGFGSSHFFNGVAGSALTYKLRSQGMAALLRQEMAFFDEDQNSSAALTGFLAEKVDKVMMLTTEQLDLVAQLLGGVTSSMFIIFYLCSWQLALVWAAVVPVMGAITSAEMAFMSGGAEEDAAKKGVELDNKKAKAEKSANHIVGECITGIRTVASNNLEHTFYEGYQASSGTVSHIMKKDALVQGFFGGFSMGALVGIMGVLFWFAVWLANEGHVNFKQAMGPMFVITGAFVPMMKAGALANIKQSTLSAVRLFKLFDAQPTIDTFSEAGAKPTECRGEIVLQDVTFAYPTAKDVLVCKGLSLRIPAGRTMALCGPSGSGKSTIIQLLERFYDPASGSVSLDGAELRSLNVRWLRAQLGLVGQEPVLFQGTVAENIAFGKATPATQQEIEEAARQANIHDDILAKLQNGYDSEVGLKGDKLSGGQKQRVAIARALVKKPAVLLLDEATASLDNISEAEVQSAINKIIVEQELTVVVIAHRLSTIRDAHCIAVMNDGRVSEQGTHEQLLANQSLYANLVMANS